MMTRQLLITVSIGVVGPTVQRNNFQSTQRRGQQEPQYGNVTVSLPPSTALCQKCSKRRSALSQGLAQGTQRQVGLLQG